MEYDIRHLKDYQEDWSGPIQSDEALFLYSLVRVVRPKTIVEFGFYKGHSAVNFLKAMPYDGILYSFDCAPGAAEDAKKIGDKRLKLIVKKQGDFKPQDIDNNKIDILFIDASHNLRQNIMMFCRVRGSLGKNALIIIHDTGAWNMKYVSEQQEEHIKAAGGAFLSPTEYMHCVPERRFANYLLKYHRGYCQIHLHSDRTLRHGMTVLQKSGSLKLGNISVISHLQAFMRIRLFRFLAFLKNKQ